MSTTRDLVDALINGDSIEIDNNFNAIMADKVSVALDNYRAQVAQTLFTGQQEETLEDVVEEDDNV